MVLCKVLVPDGNDNEFDISKTAKVENLFNAVCQKLKLEEKDYFGLTYEDKKTGKFWLDNSKKLAKYVTNGLWAFALEVKFYPPEPLALKDDSTRYQLFLQLRRDILTEKLPCSFVTLALLGSYAVQSELGDYDPAKNGKDFQYLTGISLASKQTQELLEKIAELHITHRGHSPSEAEDEYLDNAKKLSLYGVHMHNAKDSENEDVQIGVCAAGLLIFKHRLRIHRFVWAKIIKILYKRNIFTILIRPAEHEKVESTFDFKLPSYKLAKRLWKLAVEHHAFFRLKESDPDKKNMFPRFGSGYRSGTSSYRTSKGNMDGSGNLPGNMRQGGQFSKSMEGLAGHATERGEKYKEEQGQRSATLTLKGRRQGSLPLLDREEYDQSSDGNYDPKKNAEQWQINQNFDDFSTASSTGHSVNGYQRNGPKDYHSRYMNASNGGYGVEGGYAGTRSYPNQRFGGGEDDDSDDLPPYQDDRLVHQKYGTGAADGQWDLPKDAMQVKTSTRTYVGPDGSIITEHRTEREGVVETKLKKVRREKQFPDVDYDRALSDAILAVTNMNTDLAVEKIEIHTEEEQEREYYDSDEVESYDGDPGETLI